MLAVFKFGEILTDMEGIDQCNTKKRGGLNAKNKMVSLNSSEWMKGFRKYSHIITLITEVNNWEPLDLPVQSHCSAPGGAGW